MLVVDGRQVGEVLLQMRAELGVRIDLDQLLLAGRLLAVKVSHVLLRLGADLRAAAAHVVGAQHVLRRGPVRTNTLAQRGWGGKQWRRLTLRDGDDDGGAGDDDDDDDAAG